MSNIRHCVSQVNVQRYITRFNLCRLIIEFYVFVTLLQPFSLGPRSVFSLSFPVSIYISHHFIFFYFPLFLYLCHISFAFTLSRFPFHPCVLLISDELLKSCQAAPNLLISFFYDSSSSKASSRKKYFLWGYFSQNVLYNQRQSGNIRRLCFYSPHWHWLRFL